MILSIIPSQTSASFENKKPNLTEKRFSFSSPFSQITKNKSATDTDNNSQTNKKIGIHVAGPEILLPLINRPDEVKLLLENTESGTSIYQQLQKVHLPYPKEWDSVQQTLFKQGREEVSDREWLRELHSIIFTRSPRLWCHFSECIGARDVHFEEMDDGLESTVEGEDVFEVQFPTFEVLKQLPSTYCKPVDQIDTISIDDCRCNENEHVDELTESIEGQEVRHISNQTSEAFLGLRIRLRSRSEPNDGQGNISPLSIGVSADTAVIRNTRSRSRTTSTMNSLPFKKQRRLSQLFLSPTLEKSTSSPIEIPQPKLSLHGHHRSASSKGESELFDDEAASHQWYRHHRQRDLECGRTEPVGLLLNRNPIWQPFAPPVEGGQPNSKNENKKSANLEGLLPDGRTRHPSAGSGDLKASLATFRKDNQTTETSSGSASPDSINLSPSASMRIDVDSNGHALRWPSNEVLPISPITDSSDRSMPQTPGENHTILSPMTAIESSPRFIKPLYSEGQTFSDPLNAAVFRSPNINIPKQAPSTVIFPVPPCAQISRAKELTNQLNNIQQYFDGNDQDKQTIMDAFALLQSTIGSNGINQLNTLIKKAGERDCTTDEDLLRSIASNCFGLVDMDLAIENGGKILCGGGSGFDKHKRIEAEQKMKKQPWYTIQNNVPHNIAGNDDDEIYQTDQDHEARVQTYYEDVDAYAKRFVAFDALLSTIWNVDCTIMHTVRQRCGPVGHFDLKQHKQITRMTDKYLTKATY